MDCGKDEDGIKNISTKVEVEPELFKKIKSYQKMAKVFSLPKVLSVLWSDHSFRNYGQFCKATNWKISPNTCQMSFIQNGMDNFS